MDETLLPFGQALEALKQGKKVTRKIWGGYWLMEICSVDARDPNSEHFTTILAFLKDGGMAPAQPYQSDLLAEDWIILD